MDMMGTLLLYGGIWVVLTWRCFAVTSICKEVAEGKTTADALLFQLFQAGIFIFAAVTILRSDGMGASDLITSISLVLTSGWYLYSCAKAGLRLKNRKNTSASDLPE